MLGRAVVNVTRGCAVLLALLGQRSKAHVPKPEWVVVDRDRLVLDCWCRFETELDCGRHTPRLASGGRNYGRQTEIPY